MPYFVVLLAIVTVGCLVLAFNLPPLDKNQYKSDIWDDLDEPEEPWLEL